MNEAVTNMYIYKIQNTNTHKMSTKTKQMVMTTMMQAFLCRPRVIHRNVRSQSWDVFRLNYVKGKCYTQHRHRHTHTPNPRYVSGIQGWKFVSLFCFNFCWFFAWVCVLCSCALLLLTFESLTFFTVFHIFFPFVYIYICKHHHTHTHTDFAPFLLFTSSYFVPFHSHYMHFRKTITSLRYLKKHCLGSCIQKGKIYASKRFFL